MLEKEVFDSKFEHFEKALNTLKEVLVEAKKLEKGDEKIFSIYRDSAIQRFEYTYELSWKFMKFLGRYAENEVEIFNSNQSFKSAFKAGYIDDIEIWFKMISHRNKTSHEYSENISNELYFEIFNYIQAIQKFYEVIKIRYGQGYFKFNI